MKAEKKGKRAAAQEQQPRAPAAAAAAAASKKRRKPKRNAQQDDANLPQDELARRQRQRQLRDLALRLRAEGKVYKKHRKHKPRRRVQLIIVPIVWQKKKGEAAAVLAAAEAVQELLRGLGVKCDTDTTTELTPGQKFRSWEEKGVMLRVELGPKEAQEGTCILARCRTAGEVADKETLPVGPRLCKRVEQQLADMGQTLAPPPAAPAAKAATAAQGEADGAPAAVNGAAGQHQAAAAGAGAAAAQQQAQRPQRAQRSAEELEGDFAGVPLLQEQGPGKKGQRKAAAAAVAEAEVAAFKQAVAGGAEGGGGGKKAKKGKGQPKVVAF